MIQNFKDNSHHGFMCCLMSVLLAQYASDYKMTAGVVMPTVL